MHPSNSDTFLTQNMCTVTKYYIYVKSPSSNIKAVLPNAIFK